MLSLKADDWKVADLLQVMQETPEQNIEVFGLTGERYIACGWENKKQLILHGTAGNNLGAFAEGPEITLYGNGQEGVANTLSDGRLVIHGRVGDIAGYGMRGGELLVEGDAGYRLGIHMKAYQDKQPVIIVGGTAGAFAGEYMAGGTIVVLGLNGRQPLVGSFCGTGMYGGAIYLRGEYPARNIAPNIKKSLMTLQDLQSIKPSLQTFADSFNYPMEDILAETFTKLTVINPRPFAHLYTGFVS